MESKKLNTGAIISFQKKMDMHYPKFIFQNQLMNDKLSITKCLCQLGVMC